MRRLLAILMLCTLAAHAQQPATPGHTFEVASVKPSNSTDDNRSINTTLQRVKIENVPLRQIIMFSFDIRSASQIQGLPDWAETERFDIDAKVDEETATLLRKMPREDRMKRTQEMLQAVLTDRFQMKFTWSKKELPVYALTVAKTGSRLKPAAAPPPAPGADPAVPARPTGTSTHTTDGGMTATNLGMAQLADQLSHMAEMDGRVVIDKTNLTGGFDLSLEWAPETPRSTFRGADGGSSVPAASDSTKPSLFTALTEQLGLKLEQEKAPVDLLIIDKLERPTEN